VIEFRQHLHRVASNAIIEQSKRFDRPTLLRHMQDDFTNDGGADLQAFIDSKILA
jgi:hypothetical protein